MTKDVNICIGIPAPEAVHPAFAFGNLPNIIAYTQKNFKEIGPNKISLKNLMISHAQGVRTDRNRNMILMQCIKNGTIDYILWLDSDMLYPDDIIVQYFKSDPLCDITGCLYFKRPAPHDVVAYIKNKNSTTKPYNALNIKNLRHDRIYPVDALGYGGMMVSMELYKKMGKNKWTHYGENFHLPYECEGRLTHDLQFCKDAQAVGATIGLHGGVRAGHLATRVIDESMYNFYRTKTLDGSVKVNVTQKKEKK